MDLDSVVTVAIVTVLREGIKEGINWLKERRGEEGEEEEEQEAEKKAQVVALETIELKATAEPLTVKEDVDWDKVGTLFWLGNDLMWIKDMMFRGAHPERVLQGIDHALQYVRDLGFEEDSFPADELTLTRTVIAMYDGIGEIDDQIANNIRMHYRDASKNIDHVKWYMNSLVEQKQAGFKKLRAI